MVEAVLVNARVLRCTNRGDSEKAIEVGERWGGLFLGERGGDMRKVPVDIFDVERSENPKRTTPIVVKLIIFY